MADISSALGGIGRIRRCNTRDYLRRQKIPALGMTVLACDGGLGVGKGVVVGWALGL